LPADYFDVGISYKNLTYDNGAFGLGPEGEVRNHPHHVNLNMVGFNKKDDNQTTLNIAYQKNNFEIRSITGFRSWTNFVHNDADYSGVDILRTAINDDQTQLTQEFRIASNRDSNKINWLGGLYFYNEYIYQSIYIDGRLVPSGYEIRDNKNTGYALFGQTTFNLGDNLKLTTGLRFEEENKKAKQWINPTSAPFTETKQDRKFWLPKISLNYKFAKEINFYSNIAKGHRSGGFNFAFNNPKNLTFDPEFIWSYEVGAKTSWFKRALSANISLFYMDWKNQQVQLFLPGFVPIIRNARKSKSRGLEIELNALIKEHWSFNLSYGFTDARFIQFTDGTTGEDLKDRRVPLSPKHNLNLAVKYKKPIKNRLDFFVQGELQGIGSIYWDSPNLFKQKFYRLIHLSSGVEKKGWSAHLWAKNVFDKHYQSINLITPGGPRVHLGAPTMLGLTLTAKY